MKMLLALLGAAKFGKVLLTGGTMALSVAVYATIFGWRYAAGFVALLFVHEMGHFVAARQRGLEVGAPTFIPFVGAWIQLKSQLRDAETEAYVGLAGPLVGTLGALACYFAARELGAGWLLAVAYAGFFLNLFNLIPVPPLDGGRITAAISPQLWLVGVPVLVAVFLWRPSPLLILLALVAAPQVWRVLTGRATPEHAPDYYTVTAEQRVSYALTYFGLAAFLAVMCHELHEILPRGGIQ